VRLRMALLLSLALAGCASSAPELSRAERERLPRDARQEIFDAENDLTIARNREDEAAKRRRALDEAIEAVGERHKRMEKRLEASKDGAARVAGARRVLRAERDYLEAQLDAAEAQVKVAERETSTARARLELVKQRQLARIGKVPIASLPEFEKAIATREARVKEARAGDLDLRSKAQSRLDAWKAAQAEYAAQTKDFDTGVWLD
jgi:chromosome segregation ATPase